MISISIRNGDPLRDKKLQKTTYFRVCEVLAFKHTDFLKSGNVPLYLGDVATEIMRPQFIDFRT